MKEETYKKVMEKAKELDYKPNRLESILSRNEQFTITVVIPEYATFNHDFPASKRMFYVGSD